MAALIETPDINLLGLLKDEQIQANLCIPPMAPSANQNLTNIICSPWLFSYGLYANKL
jgi:hypothetical protein